MYEKQQWENLPAETTPISAERLAHLETQYDTVMADLPALMSDSETPIGSQLSATIEGLVDPIAEGAVDDAVTAQDIPGQVGSEVAAQVPPAVAGEVASQVPLAVAGAVPSAVDAELDNQTPGAVAAELAVQVPVAVDNALTLADIPGEASAQVAIALAAQAGKIVQGTGSPLGAVSASPGTIYVDTVATLGASVWRKVSGTGTTGWEVMYGDSGERNIAGLLLNGWKVTSTGRVSLHRRGSLITLLSTDLALDGIGATSSEFVHLPVGFRWARRSEATALLGVADGWSPDVLERVTGYYASSTSRANLPTGNRWTFEANFHTLDPWPATLPGTPA